MAAKPIKFLELYYTKIQKFSEHTIPVFVSSNTLPLPMLYFKLSSTLMLDVHNKLVPSNICNLFTGPYPGYSQLQYAIFFFWKPLHKLLSPKSPEKFFSHHRRKNID